MAAARKGYIVVHPDLGVYLGSFLGLGVWSKLDPAGQEGAICFSSTHKTEYITGLHPDESITLLEVDMDLGGYASLAACVKAGAPAWSTETIDDGH